MSPWAVGRERALDSLRRSGAALYGIGIGLGGEAVNRRMLGDLSEPTGAYFEVVSSSAVLEAAVGRIADDLRDQYILAFEPAKSDGRSIASKSRHAMATT